MITGILALRPVESAEEEISRPRQVELPFFAKKTPGRMFAELKIYNSPEDPIRMPREDWAGAKARLNRDKAWGEWLRSREKEVDDWMATRRDRVDWVAGWWHDFVSPRDGSFLTFTPDEPGEDTLSSASDAQVHLTSKLHGAWVYIFRSKNGDTVLEAARLYRLTGEVKYAAWASAQIDFYADHFTEWPISNYQGESRLMYQGLDDAVMLIKLVNAARLLNDYVTPARKERWIGELFKPDADMLQQSLHVINNIACWQRSAEAQVALYSGDHHLWKQAVDDPYGIRDELSRGITSDYLWYEQSLGYNGYVVQALLPFFTYALLENRGGELKKEMEMTENLMLTPIMMRFPNGQTPNPADSTGQVYAPDVSLLVSASQIFPTRLGLRGLATEKNWIALIDPAAGDISSAALPPVTSRNMESSRMAIIRNGPWQVFFHYGQLTRSHAQAEALNFEAFFGDADVSHDPGTAGYGSPMTREYYRTGLCHNVPLVDGLGQEAWNPGKFDRFTSTSVAASQPLYRRNARASRKLKIEGNILSDRESIATTDGAEHALGFMLNLEGKIKFTSSFTAGVPLAGSARPVGFKYFQDVTNATFKDMAQFDLHLKTADLHITLALPGLFTIWHASVPDCPPNRREALYIETRGKAATLRTTFAPFPKVQPNP